MHFVMKYGSKYYQIILLGQIKQYRVAKIRETQKVFFKIILVDCQVPSATL